MHENANMSRMCVGQQSQSPAATSREGQLHKKTISNTKQGSVGARSLTLRPPPPPAAQTLCSARLRCLLKRLPIISPHLINTTTLTLLTHEDKQQAACPCCRTAAGPHGNVLETKLEHVSQQEKVMAASMV